MSPSFWTLLRYRSEYGTSFLEEAQGSDMRCYARLLYQAIRGERPYFHIFEASCRADKTFLASAARFVRQLVRGGQKGSDAGKGGEGSADEFDILALCAFAGIPERVLDILSIAQVADVIGRYAQIKAGKQAPHEMSAEERKGIYGISPEREAAIEEYLFAHPEEITAEDVPAEEISRE